MRASTGILGLALVALSSASFAADDPEKIYENLTGAGPTSWSEYLVDTAAGSVSAAGMLEISGDRITTVENVRDIVVGLKGLSGDESKGTLALSITPALTDITPMPFSTYINDPYFLATIFGSMTIGYAQGEADIEGTTYERRAVSLETSFLFNRKKDDPVLVFEQVKRANAKATKDGETQDLGECDLEGALKEAGFRGAASPDEDEGDRPAAGFPFDPEKSAKFSAAVEACYAQIEDSIRWNRSRASLSVATGWIKGKSNDGLEERKMGRVLAAGATYGFDGVEWGGLNEKMALSITYRRTLDEPILTTLDDEEVSEKDSSLTAGTLTFGSKKIRALVEVSDARSEDITASQRAFRQAVGLDFRAFKETWVNFRWGQQRTIEGDDNEIGSLLTISYSPTALIAAD